MVIAMSYELDNIAQDGHRYAEQVTKTLKTIRSTRKIRIRTHMPDTYAIAALCAKDISVRTSRLEHTKPHTLRNAS